MPIPLEGQQLVYRHSRSNYELPPYFPDILAPYRHQLRVPSFIERVEFVWSQRFPSTAIDRFLKKSGEKAKPFQEASFAIYKSSNEEVRRIVIGWEALEEAHNLYVQSGLGKLITETPTSTEKK